MTPPTLLPAPGAAIRAGFALAALLLFAGGCNNAGNPTDPSVRGPFFAPRNYTGVAQLPATLRRVVLLPTGGAPGVPVETLASLDLIMASELQQQARFEVVTIDAAALFRSCGQARFLSSDLLPANLLEVVTRQFDADAVMFVDVTSLSAYPPLTIGFRAKLVALPRGSILWSFDQLFSAGEPSIANGARRHDRRRNPSADGGDLSYTVLQSPARFGDYVAATAFATLPPR